MYIFVHIHICIYVYECVFECVSIHAYISVSAGHS